MSLVSENWPIVLQIMQVTTTKSLGFNPNEGGQRLPMTEIIYV